MGNLLRESVRLLRRQEKASGTVFEQADGFADIAGRVSMASTMTMAVFSMTKALTAIGVLKLVEEGALRLDDPAAPGGAGALLPRRRSRARIGAAP
jgi:CubicO group peptidase (beta-lactamase class C family)